MRRLLSTIFVTLIISLPVCVSAAGLIPCGQDDDTCRFRDFAVLIQQVISFLAFYIAAPLATLAIMYAGFKYLTSMDKPGPREEAKKILQNVLIGFFFVLGAWLIIDTILDVLLKNNPLN